MWTLPASFWPSTFLPILWWPWRKSIWTLGIRNSRICRWARRLSNQNIINKTKQLNLLTLCGGRVNQQSPLSSSRQPCSILRITAIEKILLENMSSRIFCPRSSFYCHAHEAFSCQGILSYIPVHYYIYYHLSLLILLLLLPSSSLLLVLHVLFPKSVLYAFLGSCHRIYQSITKSTCFIFYEYMIYIYYSPSFTFFPMICPWFTSPWFTRYIHLLTSLLQIVPKDTSIYLQVLKVHIQSFTYFNPLKPAHPTLINPMFILE